jgi:hypothetical protein
MDMSKPFIAAFKAGATSVDSYITEDLLVHCIGLLLEASTAMLLTPAWRGSTYSTATS